MDSTYVPAFYLYVYVLVNILLIIVALKNATMSVKSYIVHVYQEYLCYCVFFL